MLARFAARIAPRLILRVLIVGGELRHVRLSHALDAFAESGNLDIGQMRENFAHRPALHRGFPLQLIFTGERNELLDDNGRLLEYGDSRQSCGFQGGFSQFLQLASREFGDDSFYTAIEDAEEIPRRNFEKLFCAARHPRDCGRRAAVTCSRARERDTPKLEFSRSELGGGSVAEIFAFVDDIFFQAKMMETAEQPRVSN